MAELRIAVQHFMTLSYAAVDHSENNRSCQRAPSPESTGQMRGEKGHLLHACRALRHTALNTSAQRAGSALFNFKRGMRLLAVTNCHVAGIARAYASNAAFT